MIHWLIYLLAAGAGAAVTAALLNEQALRDRLSPHKLAGSDVGFLIKQAMDEGRVQYVAGVVSADRSRERHREVIQADQLDPALAAKFAGKRQIDIDL